jgi:16S rRNA (guanine527-N7)-methyltransferase
MSKKKMRFMSLNYINRIITLMVDLSHDVSTLLGIQLTVEQLEAFEIYERELIEWNARFNLTSITDPQQIRIRHFLDSLSCWLAMQPLPLGRVIDLGAGAGFPGLPLKILQPQLELTLVEATAKKAGFLEHIVQVLRLERVTVLARRAEEVGQMPEHREAYDWAVARALAPMPVLAEYMLPLVKLGGRMLAQKGRDAKLETQQAASAFQALGGELAEVLPVSIPHLVEERWLVTVAKTASTPAKYPRRVGIPSKRPLS